MPPSSGVFKRLQKAELSDCRKACTFLQSDFWGAFKGRFGWQALAFEAEWDDNAGGTFRTPLLVLCRSLGFGFSLAYVPWGPQLPDFFPSDESARGEALKELALAVKSRLSPDTAFIRFDPPWYTEGKDSLPPPIPSPFVRSSADIQAPDSVLIDLSPPLEDILAQMKPKWRYNARLALKKGVTVRRALPEEIGVFYDLLKETARRDGIAIHGSEYYQTLLANKAEENGIDVRLYLAEHEGDVLAGIVTLFRGFEAVYMYGASSDKKRSLMSPYALQVKALEDAKASGCGQYDLFGIPPNADPAHPMAGLYLFKTGFGGRIIHRPGSWDFPCRPFPYRLFRLAERVRKNLRTLKKKARR